MKTKVSMNRTICGLISFNLLLCVGCGGTPAVAPTSYASYKSTDKLRLFRCEYPEGWEVKGGGKNNAWVKFSSGSALIEARADITGSLLGDIVVVGQDAEDMEPVAKIHAMAKQDAATAFDGYAEVGDAVKFKCNLGPARRSEFTASGTMGASVHGYRATFMTRDRRVVTYCTCSQSDWQTLQPAFEKVLLSFSR